MYLKPARHRLPSTSLTAAIYTTAMLVMLAGLVYYCGHQLFTTLANWRFPCLPR
ncbi:MAG: hypothetical protein WC734_04300 [Patescibacteria group bacterium]